MEKATQAEPPHDAPRLKFQALLRLEGKTATGIQVPAIIIAGLGSSKKPPVCVTINGRYTYRTTVAAMGGEFWLPVSAEHRQNAGIAAGDTLDLEIELDTEVREVSVPPDFAAALAQDAEAGRFFERISYSNKRRFVLAVEDAKTPETRQRRIAKAVSTLHEGKTM